MAGDSREASGGEEIGDLEMELDEEEDPPLLEQVYNLGGGSEEEQATLPEVVSSPIPFSFPDWTVIDFRIFLNHPLPTLSFESSDADISDGLVPTGECSSLHIPTDESFYS